MKGLIALVVILAAAAATPAAAAPGAGDCVKCHLCDKPSAQQPCLPSCPRQMGQPTWEDFSHMELPETCVLDHLVDRYEPVVFNHAQHARMSGMGGNSCRLCHHPNEQGFVGNCYGCHPAHLSGMHVGVPDLKTAYHRQCMFCHRDWSHETNCEICHAPRGAGVPRSMPPQQDLDKMHAFRHREMPATLNFETSHDPAPHVTFDHAAHVDRYKLSCFECHSNDRCGACHESSADALYDGLHDYSNINICTKCHNVGRCSTCHSEQENRPFDHDLTGMPLKPYHKGLSCERCHVDRVAHGAMPRECGGCHGRGDSARFESADFDHAAQVGVDLREFHEGMHCRDCHPKGDYEAPPACHDCHEAGMDPGKLR